MLQVPIDRSSSNWENIQALRRKTRRRQVRPRRNGTLTNASSRRIPQSPASSGEADVESPETHRVHSHFRSSGSHCGVASRQMECHVPISSSRFIVSPGVIPFDYPSSPHSSNICTVKIGFVNSLTFYPGTRVQPSQVALPACGKAMKGTENDSDIVRSASLPTFISSTSSIKGRGLDVDIHRYIVGITCTGGVSTTSSASPSCGVSTCGGALRFVLDRDCFLSKRFIVSALGRASQELWKSQGPVEVSPSHLRVSFRSSFCVSEQFPLASGQFPARSTASFFCRRKAGL